MESVKQKMRLKLILERLELGLRQTPFQLGRFHFPFAKAAIVLQSMADDHESHIIEKIPVKAAKEPEGETFGERKCLRIKNSLYQNEQNDMRERKQGAA